MRDLVPLEPPDGNVRGVPKHGINATGSHIEGGTSASLDVGEGTTGIVTTRAPALSREWCSEETLVRRAVRALVFGSNVGVHLANRPTAGMKGVLVEIVGVDVFEDIDLRGNVSIGMCGRNEEEMVITSPLSGQPGLEVQVIFLNQITRETEWTYPTAKITVEISMRFPQEIKAINSPQKAGQTEGPWANFQKSAITRAPL